MKEYPTKGCKKAYECGQELYLSGVTITPELIGEALDFCETQQERVYFCMGMIMEASDLEEVVGA